MLSNVEDLLRLEICGPYDSWHAEAKWGPTTAQQLLTMIMPVIGKRKTEGCKCWTTLCTCRTPEQQELYKRIEILIRYTQLVSIQYTLLGGQEEVRRDVDVKAGVDAAWVQKACCQGDEDPVEKEEACAAAVGFGRRRGVQEAGFETCCKEGALLVPASHSCTRVESHPVRTVEVESGVQGAHHGYG